MEPKLKQLLVEFNKMHSSFLGKAEECFYNGDTIGQNHYYTCSRQWATAIKMVKEIFPVESA